MYKTVAQYYAAEFCGHKKMEFTLHQQKCLRQGKKGSERDRMKEERNKRCTELESCETRPDLENQKNEISPKSYRHLLESCVTLGNSSKKEIVHGDTLFLAANLWSFWAILGIGE